MAIIIIKEPSGIYSAYNDSYIEFSSDLVDNNKAEITVYPTTIFSKVFTLYPDADGNYLFNLKESVKVIFNTNGFSDANFDLSVYFKSISGLYLSQDILIKVLSDTAEEQLAKTYEFYKSVKQIGELIYSNPFQLLTNSEDGVDHYMTYNEGFPFYFDIQRVIYAVDKEITVKNLNTGDETAAMQPTFTGAFRVVIDRSEGNNWTSDNVLPLTTGLNRLEIYEDGVFKSNLFLKKTKKCSGVYLKWFNSQGGFSHFLFDKFYNEITEGNDAGRVLNNDFGNIADITGMSKSVGKDGERSLTVRAKYDEFEYEILKDILISPCVQMWSEYERDIAGRYIDVSVDGSMSFSNKKGLNTIVVSIDLPEMITLRL